MPPSVLPPIDCVSAPLSNIDTDVLIVPWFEGESPSSIPGLDAATGGEIGRALVSKEFTARPFEYFATPIGEPQWRARRILLIGAGPAADCGSELLRKLAAAAGMTVRTRRAERAAFLLRGTGETAERSQAVAEGLTLSEFNAGSYKTGDLVSGGGSSLDGGCSR